MITITLQNFDSINFNRLNRFKDAENILNSLENTIKSVLSYLPYLTYLLIKPVERNEKTETAKSFISSNYVLFENLNENTYEIDDSKINSYLDLVSRKNFSKIFGDVMRIDFL
jgi:hypothetical protein